MKRLPEHMRYKPARDIIDMVGAKFKDQTSWCRYMEKKMEIAIENAIKTCETGDDEIEVERARSFLCSFVKDSECLACPKKGS